MKELIDYILVFKFLGLPLGLVVIGSFLIGYFASNLLVLTINGVGIILIFIGSWGLGKVLGRFNGGID